MCVFRKNLFITLCAITKRYILGNKLNYFITKHPLFQISFAYNNITITTRKHIFMKKKNIKFNF